MSSSEEEVVLKKSTTALIVDKVSEFMMTGAWGVITYIQVEKSDSLADVRSWINQHLDKDIVRKHFLLQVNYVVVSKEEEVNTLT
eukprot:1953016-Ditylum_brightwellii.AAC.1